MPTSYVFSQSNEPYFNIAAEEFLFKECCENLVFFYINTPSVVIGKHQNALAEVNSEYIKAASVKVVRRISGGGAVYHDLGNLNFSFHQTVPDISTTSYKTMLEPMLDAIRSLGVDAKFSPRNDMLVEGRKFSGNAVHVFRNRVMCHGTLLFNANRSALSEALKVDQTKYTDRSVKSVRSEITNLIDYLPKAITINEFATSILNSIIENSSENKIRGLTDDEIGKINQLVDQKYSTWEWNYGYSPEYSIKCNREIEVFGNIELQVEVKKGIIVSAKIAGSGELESKFSQVCELIIGIKHREDEIQTLFRKINFSEVEVNALSGCLF